jgi:hypothetical protein
VIISNESTTRDEFFDPELDKPAAPGFGGVFEAAVGRVLGPPPGQPALPHVLLARGAALGFAAEEARVILADHQSLAYLNRLWDAYRHQGQRVGGVRVPSVIWELANQPTEVGRLHEQLLEYTGLRLAPDFDRDLELHLTLWAQSLDVVRSRNPVFPAATQVSAASGGPVSVHTWRDLDGTVLLSVGAEQPGLYDLTLHWPDGTTHALTVAVDEGGYAEVACPGIPADPPQSVHVARRSPS